MLGSCIETETEENKTWTRARKTKIELNQGVPRTESTTWRSNRETQKVGGKKKKGKVAEVPGRGEELGKRWSPTKAFGREGKAAAWGGDYPGKKEGADPVSVPMFSF